MNQYREIVKTAPDDIKTIAAVVAPSLHGDGIFV